MFLAQKETRDPLGLRETKVTLGPQGLMERQASQDLRERDLQGLPDPRGYLESLGLMVALVKRGRRGTPVSLVWTCLDLREIEEPQGAPDPRVLKACPGNGAWQAGTDRLATQVLKVRWVSWGHQECQDTVAPQEHLDPLVIKVTQVLPDQEAGLVSLDLREREESLVYGAHLET